MQCSNNLKQIGLALHNYHDVYRTFPYASTSDTPNTTDHVWVEFILPFVEQNTLHDQINFNIANSATANKALLENLTLKFISCPSNPRTEQMFPNGETIWASSFASQGLDYPVCAGTIWPSGTTPDCPSENSYCVSEDSTTETWRYYKPLRDGPGVFNRNTQSSRMANVTDGTSHVFLAGERLAQECKNGGAFTRNFPIAYMGQKPNSPSRDDDVSDWKRNCGYSSKHPGGVSMLMGDASVSFVAETIDFAVWCRLGDKADGNSVQLP
ncbi:DUF1559 domain-containing protein [Blastopirellula sp. J2-11]|nr:DUF1559 domain-containing protein [Blastopirellula sp. J2-11]